LLDARNGYALHLRNLGVNFIEHCIKSADSSAMNQLRLQFWSLMFCEVGAFKLVGEKSILKEKACYCMAMLACRLWLKPEDDPLQWNDFFEAGIIEGVLKSTSPIDPNEHLRRQEFALMVIAELVLLIRTPVSDSVLNISEDRRLQLHAGLEIVLPSFTEWLFINFPVAVGARVNSRVLNAAVSCFRAICPWMGSNSLDVQGIELFIAACFQILVGPVDQEGDEDEREELCMNILDTLQIYFSSKSFSPSELRIMEFFMTTLQPQWIVLLQSYSANEDSYQKLKVLIQCFTSIGCRYLFNRKHPLLLKNINELLGIFIAVAQIPSMSIYLEFLDLFANMLRCDIFLEKVDIKPHVEALFMLLATKMTLDRNTLRQSAFNQVDFEDDGEFSEFWKLSEGRGGALVKALAAKFPELLLTFSYNALGTFVQSKCFTSATWEGLLTIEDFVGRGCGETEGSVNFQQNYLLHLQLLTLHGPVPEKEPVLNRWISCVKAFTSLLGDACPADDFKRTIEGLFALAVGGTARSEANKSAAAIAILKLADSNSKLFLPLLEPLLSAVSGLLQTSPSNSWERKLFSELILIFMAQPEFSEERQMQLFAVVADPLAELLKTAKAALCSGSDPALQLMRHLGFAQLASSAPLSLEFRQFASNLNLLLSTLQILFKRIGPLVRNTFYCKIVQTCLQVLDELVGYLMLMIQCIHRMGTKQLWCDFFGSDREYNEFFPKMLCFLDDDSESSTEDSITKLQPYIHLAGWMRHHRQTCYLVLGLAASSFGGSFFELPGFTERFMTQPLSFLEALSLSDWNVLIKLLLKPVLSDAPEDFVPALVGASLTGLFSLLGAKLAEQWNAVIVANASAKATTGAALALEMAREAKCNSLSQTFVSFLVDLLHIPALESIKCVSLFCALEEDNLLPEIQFENQGSPAKWLFSHAPLNLLVALMDFLGTAMVSWPRSASCTYVRLVNLQIRLLAGVMARSDFPNRAELLSKSVNYAESAWALPTWTDHQQPLIALFNEQYKWAFLLAAARAHTGPMLFDTDTAVFLKNCKLDTQLTLFESCLLTKIPAIPHKDLFSLRPQILCTESLKAQRGALRALLLKYSQNSSNSATLDFKQRELSSRLTEMKKNITRSAAMHEESENIDSLLFDLFN
jgi:hypothetical protein